VQFGPDAPDAALPPQHHLPDAHLLQHQPTAQDLVETAHHHREVRSAISIQPNYFSFAVTFYEQT
jgi:hypothetical protein